MLLSTLHLLCSCLPLFLFFFLITSDSCQGCSEVAQLCLCKTTLVCPAVVQLWELLAAQFGLWAVCCTVLQEVSGI